MTPFVRSGDVLAVEPLRGRPLSTGDVILHAPGPRLVAHRVVGRRGALVRSRGDIAPCEDAPVAPGDVLGIVAGIERDGRRVRLGPRPVRVAIALLSRAGILRGLAVARERLLGASPIPADPAALVPEDTPVESGPTHRPLA
jgi:hypothetical protein